MSIDPTDFESWQTDWYEPEPPSDDAAWKLVGDFALGASFTIALTASLAYFTTTKKRKITLLSPNGPEGGASMSMEIEEKTPSVSEEKSKQPCMPAPRDTLERQKHVAEIFTTVATTKIESLMGAGVTAWFQGNENPVNKLRHLESILENPSNPIHPFAFLLAVPKNHVQAILKENSRLKLYGPFGNDGVIGGVKRGMERELKAKNLEPFIDDFAKNMGTTVAKIRPLIQARDWAGFVRHLFRTNDEQME